MEARVARAPPAASSPFLPRRRRPPAYLRPAVDDLELDQGLGGREGRPREARKALGTAMSMAPLGSSPPLPLEHTSDGSHGGWTTTVGTAMSMAPLGSSPPLPLEHTADGGRGGWTTTVAQRPSAGTSVQILLGDMDGGQLCFGSGFWILAPTLYIFFASALPVITFGEQLIKDPGSSPTTKSGGSLKIRGG